MTKLKIDKSQQIKNAITWYEREKSVIVKTLPAKIEGVTFTLDWIGSIERSIGFHKSGKFGQQLSISYIVNPLKKIRKHL